MKIGKILYTEFFKPLGDYYSILKIKYCIYELVIPAVIGVGCAFVYSYYNKVENALDKLCDILPDTIAILIGFSSLLITLLLTGNENAIERLKRVRISNRVNANNIHKQSGGKILWQTENTVWTKRKWSL